MRTTSKVLFALILGALSVSPIRAAHPLEEWGQRTAPGTGYGLNAVAFGNGIFMAVGGNGTTLISADGVNWTNSSPGNYGELRNVHFLNGEFNVVGNTNRLLRSADGVNWTAFTLPPGNYWDVAYGNNVYLVVGSGQTFASTDSVNWRDAAPRINVFPQGDVAVRVGCVVFGAGEFVAMPLYVNYPAEQGFFHSTNGTNWTFTSGPYNAGVPNVQPSDMIYADGLFLIASRAPRGIYSSSNGVSWTGASAGNGFGTPGAIAYGAGYFVVAQNPPPDGGVFSSTNAITWQRRAGLDPSSAVPTGVAFGNGTFVVVGINGSDPIIYQSGNLSGAPTILIEPLDRAAVVNNPASFSVLANGAEPLSYQWQKDGAPISGATNSSFTISSVVATDGGGYRVIVTNSFGSVTSRVAQLSVSFLQIHEYAGITILGVPGKTYRVEASPAAGGGSWTVLTNLVLPSSSYIWIDYDSPNVATRIYRAAELP